MPEYLIILRVENIVREPLKANINKIGAIQQRVAGGFLFIELPRVQTKLTACNMHYAAAVFFRRHCAPDLVRKKTCCSTGERSRRECELRA